MKKVYFSISLRSSNHFTAWTNFDLLQILNIKAKQQRKNIPVSDGIYMYEITRLDYKHIKELQGALCREVGIEYLRAHKSPQTGLKIVFNR